MFTMQVIGWDAVAGAFRGAGLKAQVKRIEAMRRILMILTADVTTRLSTGRPRVRTGTLRRSIGWTMNLRGTEGRVGPKGPPYGRIQELGGEVRPVTRQWLTIPLEAAKTRAGVGRGRALDFQDTFFLRSRAGNLILAMKNGTGITPLFVLKKQVRVPASPYLSPVLAARRETIVAIMGDAYVAAVQP